MSATQNDIPDSGSLQQQALPRLLLALCYGRFDGTLELTSARSQKNVTFQQGAPIRAESNLSSETLGLQLVSKGLLTRQQHEQVCEYVARKHCREGVALLALELIAPKDLFVELKDQVRRRLIDVFGWANGQYALRPGLDAGGEVQPLRCDPLALVQEGLLTHWSVDRMLADLTPRMEKYPRLRRGFRKLVDRLETDAAADDFLHGLDGRQSFGRALGSALGSARALSLAWLLDAASLLDYRDQPQQVPGEGPDFESEIELELDSAPAGRAATRQPRETAGRQTASASGATDRSTALRQQILERHASLLDLDYYELLDLEPSAKAGAIKKAYFKVAKLYHPDSLLRLGLADLKPLAAEVFARIAEAFDVLSNESKRKNYEATLRGELSEAQTARLAQAETSFRKGEILLRMGDFRGALEYLRPAVELWPEECAYQSALGWALYKQTPPNSKAARTHLEKAVAIDGQDAVAHFRLGMALRALGESQAAGAHLARAKQLDPNQR